MNEIGAPRHRAGRSDERCVERDLGHGRERLRDGAPTLAPSAASRKAASSIPGTVPRTRSALFVIPVPGTNVTVADVSSRSGGEPACASECESAIEKHDAWAAATSSFGARARRRAPRCARPT